MVVQKHAERIIIKKKKKKKKKAEICDDAQNKGQNKKMRNLRWFSNMREKKKKKKSEI